MELDGNQPQLSLEDFTGESFETYSPLDSLGRCGAAYACIGQDLMPTEDRESISSVHPTGWVQAEYSFVDGGSLYNRCHLIGFQLTGENANEENLITGHPLPECGRGCSPLETWWRTISRKQATTCSTG